MFIPAVGGARASSDASINAQVSQLRRQERQLTRELTELVSEGGVKEGNAIKQRTLESQIVVIQMRIAQLEARRSEGVQAALSKALPSLSEHGTEATSPASQGRAGSPAGGLDIEL